MGCEWAGARPEEAEGAGQELDADESGASGVSVAQHGDRENLVSAVGLPAVRDLRATIESFTYEDVSSIRDASVLREKMAAAADVAKRAGADEAEYRRLAREAERALGRMILAGRDAGDLANQGGDRRSNVAARPLKELGIERHLAEDATAFARVPDDVWDNALVEAPSRASLSTAVRRWLERVS